MGLDGELDEELDSGHLTGQSLVVVRGQSLSGHSRGLLSKPSTGEILEKEHHFNGRVAFLENLSLPSMLGGMQLEKRSQKP